ncbi:putative transcriptional regulatory protein YesN [Lentibacillus sp. JNUCC-1]|uniref:response regulator n=1 Tax=Lentibacillus sp. JNUCC-1 TaxID=2654513 RepID=UPI0012E8D09C|nr:response regulator [Lentibacillus sp. JNUCC-1]MUV37284.1 putative transcriptional regulatory protein YesN [Lentibacillus sp. JNUCC-1]
MRILIAEDELLERKAMKKFIEVNFSDMEVVGEAANGRQAIELAAAANPDIIFMDIKMPGINGLEAIEKIMATNPSVRFILVSAYDSFDYAKQAMRYGVRDYILKPGKKDEIVKALLRIKKEIQLEQQDEMEKLASRRLSKESFLIKLTKHPVGDEVYELQEKLFPDMVSGCFLVMSSHEEEQSLHKIEAALKTHVETDFLTAVNNECVNVCLISDRVMQKETLLTAVRKLHVELGNDLFIGIGRPVESLEKLPSSYHEAYTACFQLKADRKSRYGFIQAENAPEQAGEVIAEICNRIEKGNSEEAVQHFDEKQHLMSEADRETLYIAARTILEAQHVTFPKTSLSSLRSQQDWIAFLKICCMKLNEMYTSNQHISRAKQYIKENFNKTITLEEVAEFVELSPNYLSNLFKQAYGDTFIDFLTKERLNQAKYLLQENSYSLKEISFMVGYNDPNYFSRVFKKHYNLSPRQFQKEIFKK